MPNVNMFAPVGVTVAPSASRGTLYTVGANGVVSVDANDVPDLLSRGFEFTPQLGQAPVSRNPYILAQSGLAVILPSSGTANASGQITLTTALPATPVGTVGVYLPAGVVTSGSQGSGAGVYQATFSSTTVCQLTGTSIVTASAGYTQDTTEVLLASTTVPGGAIGANGSLRITTAWTVPNNANAKTSRVRLGGIAGVAYLAFTNPSILSYADVRVIRNRGSQSAQVGAIGAAAGSAFSSSTAAIPTGSLDTSTAQTAVATGQLAVATDYLILEGMTVEVMPSA